MAWIEQRGKNTWRLSVPGGTGQDGSRKTYRKVVEAKSRREAQKLLDLFSAEVQKGQFVAPAKLPLKDFVERWLKDYGQTNLAPKTLFRYKQLLDLRIIPALGHLRMEEIKPVHLLEFYKGLQESTRMDNKAGELSSSTIHYHHRVLSSLFNDAVEWQVISYNPASRVKPPKVRHTQAKYYDLKQTISLLQSLDNEPLKYRTGIILTLATGLRLGELLGLEWQDVNFDECFIRIRQVSQYLPGKGVFTKEPKTETSKRVISVPNSVLVLLKEYRKAWLEDRLKVD